MTGTPPSPSRHRSRTKTGLEKAVLARVDDQTHAAFVERAKARKTTPSKLLRKLMSQELGKPLGSVMPSTSEMMEMALPLPESVWIDLKRFSVEDGVRPQAWISRVVVDAVAERLVHPDIEPNEASLNHRRFTLRMPGFLADGVKRRAEKLGMSENRWIVALVQSNLMRLPVFSDREVTTLENTNRELFSIGININQMARVLNEAHFKTEQVRLEKLAELASYIRKTRDSIRSLIRASRGVWRNEE